jgi:uridylate kinase
MIPMSIGGGVLFSKEDPALNRGFFTGLLEFLREETSDERTVIMVIGGGILARMRQNDAKFFGVTDPKKLDMIGLRVTRHNSYYIKDLLAANEMHVDILRLGRKNSNGIKFHPGCVYVCGGMDTGHTSDYVAVRAAIACRSCTIFNIGARKGLHPFTEKGFDSASVIDSISFEEYLQKVPEHKPGENIPFDRQSTELARDNGISIVLLGPDIRNFRKCLDGGDFAGTIIHP